MRESCAEKNGLLLFTVVMFEIGLSAFAWKLGTSIRRR